MPLTLNDKTCFVFFELKYFYNHAPIFGNLITIKVWVALEACIGEPAVHRHVLLSREFIDVSVPAAMGQIPREQVALVDTAEIPGPDPFCKSVRLGVVHMFVNCGDL